MKISFNKYLHKSKPVRLLEENGSINITLGEGGQNLFQSLLNTHE